RGSSYVLGVTAVSCTATDSHANTASAGFNVTVADTTAPVITSVLPQGIVTSSSPTISASYSDSGTGVGASTVEVLLDGLPLTGCTAAADHVDCPASNLGHGPHAIDINIKDMAGNAGSASGSFDVEAPLTYYFPWYDNDAVNGMQGDWIMIMNEGAAPEAADLYIGGTKVFSFDGGASAGHGSLIQPGGQVSWQSPHTIVGGPVKVISEHGEKLLVSQRVLCRGSFSEIVAPEESALSSDNYFSWYDNNSSWGMKGNWILVGNAGSTPAKVDVYIGDQTEPKTTMFIPPGGNVEWQSPSTLDAGPVRVVDTNGNHLSVSQRVLYDSSFNEVLGVPRDKIDTEGYFTWYDNNAAWGMNENWVLATNLGDQPTTVQIYIDKTAENPVATLGPIAPGEMAIWRSPVARTDGPVRVISPPPYSQTLLVSQRVIFKDSFEEVQGISPHDMSSSATFNWYDNSASTGMRGDWLLIGNENDHPQDVNISIGGVPLAWHGSTTLTVDSNSSIFPSFDGLVGGPVSINCLSCAPGENLIFSQRVIFKDSFNEVVGKSGQ
ncbi:MAG: hypothetical protein ACYC6Z_10180, partial [Thermoleophilia bacterium]